jgi:tetratricopeptide (TPR) repeat protein
VSVINKMLQDLDRRSAVEPSAADAGAPAVKAVSAERSRGHEWFWRVLAALVLVSVAWVGWVAYQLQPRPLVTPLALLAAQQSAARPAAADRPPENPAPEPVAPKAQVSLPVETLRLARSIDTPIVEPKPKPAKPQPAQSRKPAPERVPQLAAPGATRPAVDKRERSASVTETAEARFRRAAALLNQARISEAEEQLAAALQADPSHVPARQAYVALLLEQQRVAAAMRLLREAVELDPGHPVFAPGLARIYVEQRDYSSALSVIDKAGAAAQAADFQALKAAVLQRLGRHAEAVAAYQDAVQKSAQPGGTWAGLGISLEAVGRPTDAVQAYRRALGAEPLPVELRNYTEDRIRVLQ